MSKFEILHKCVRHKTTDLKFCIRFVRGWSTKRRIFCAVFWICSIIVMMTLFDDDQILKAYTKDIEDNATYREARQTAERMIRDGEMPLEKIARYVPTISLEELKKLEEEIMELV